MHKTWKQDFRKMHKIKFIINNFDMFGYLVCNMIKIIALLIS